MNKILTQSITPMFNEWYLNQYLAQPNYKSTAELKLDIFWAKPFAEQSGVIKHFFFHHGIDMVVDKDTQSKDHYRAYVYLVGYDYIDPNTWVSSRQQDQDKAQKAAFKRACMVLRKSDHTEIEDEEIMYSESAIIDLVERYIETINHSNSTNDPAVKPIHKSFREWLQE